MTSTWPRKILKNFGDAAPLYNKEAGIQKDVAWQLAKRCSKESIPEGIWTDLGAGTGLLAEALEELNPNQSVLRVDGSQEMLAQHKPESQTKLWDLNFGLPTLCKPPSLIASSFALHWLHNPTRRIEEWFSALTPGGWLAIALPVKGSFREWHLAANKAGVPCTAMSLPSHESLLEVFHPRNIRYKKLQNITQKAYGVRSLLKPMIKVGAQASPQDHLSVGEWKKLKGAWLSDPSPKSLRLTWIIQILLVQK